MTIPTLFILLSNSLLSCADTTIKAVHVEYIIPQVNADSTISEFDLKYDVYYYKQYIMFKLAYDFDTYINFQLQSTTLRHRYLVFHKDSSFGQLYYPDTPHQLPHGRQEVAPFLKTQLQGSLYDTFAKVKPDSIYREQEVLVKAFKLPPSENFPEHFTALFYYRNALTDIPFRLSEMDNEKGLKLFKIRMIGKGAYHEKFRRTLPPREVRLEMTGIKKISEEALHFLERYQKEISKSK